MHRIRIVAGQRLDVRIAARWCGVDLDVDAPEDSGSNVSRVGDVGIIGPGRAAQAHDLSPVVADSLAAETAAGLVLSRTRDVLETLPGEPVVDAVLGLPVSDAV